MRVELIICVFRICLVVFFYRAYKFFVVSFVFICYPGVKTPCFFLFLRERGLFCLLFFINRFLDFFQISRFSFQNVAPTKDFCRWFCPSDVLSLLRLRCVDWISLIDETFFLSIFFWDSLILAKGVYSIIVDNFLLD